VLNRRRACPVYQTGADPLAQSDTGWTPLHSAAKWNQASCVELLLSWGKPNNSSPEMFSIICSRLPTFFTGPKIICNLWMDVIDLEIFSVLFHFVDLFYYFYRLNCVGHSFAQCSSCPFISFDRCLTKPKGHSLLVYRVHIH
jgi:ankyrin repeat protein